MQRQIFLFCSSIAFVTRYFCRSIEHDAMTRQCVLSEEDSVSQKDDVTVSASPTHHFYDLVCLDNRKYFFITQCTNTQKYVRTPIKCKSVHNIRKN